MNPIPSIDWSPAGLLQQLIRIPSVNPLGPELVRPTRSAGEGDVPRADPIFGEARLTEFLTQVCEALGLGWVRQAVHPGRENLIALLPGQPVPSEGGQLLLWEAHQDTVPVDGMTIDPFGGEVSGGRIYGRGACDVKGSMAAMLAALARLVKEPAAAADVRPTIVLACTVNEERGFTGAAALAGLLRGDAMPSGGEAPLAGFFPRPPDAAIIAEPTQLNVVVAHKGVVRWKCHVHGRAAHTSDPAAGANAIHAMARVIAAVEQYQREVLSSAEPHPLCGAGSACVTTIRGGAAENVVPELATIGIDRRLAPGEAPQAAYRALIEYIAARVNVPGCLDVSGCRIEHDEPFMHSRGLAGDDNGPLAAALVEAVRPVHDGCRTIGVSFGTDAPPISAAGVPAVVFGPGSIDEAHTADEWIAVAQLEGAAEVFYRIGRQGLRLG